MGEEFNGWKSVDRCGCVDEFGSCFCRDFFAVPLFYQNSSSAISVGVILSSMLWARNITAWEWWFVDFMMMLAPRLSSLFFVLCSGCGKTNDNPILMWPPPSHSMSSAPRPSLKRKLGNRQGQEAYRPETEAENEQRSRDAISCKRRKKWFKDK